MLSVEALKNIIRISLTPLGLWSASAEELLLMTCAHESIRGRYNKQLNGPALGIYQMEPDTLFDIYNTFLNYSKQKELLMKISAVTGVLDAQELALQYNPLYATVMARLKYWRCPDALPEASDQWGLAEYAKDVYNTAAGSATPEKYYHAYRNLILA